MSEPGTSDTDTETTHPPRTDKDVIKEALTEILQDIPAFQALQNQAAGNDTTDKANGTASATDNPSQEPTGSATIPTNPDKLGCDNSTVSVIKYSTGVVVVLLSCIQLLRVL